MQHQYSRGRKQTLLEPKVVPNELIAKTVGWVRVVIVERPKGLRPTIPPLWKHTLGTTFVVVTFVHLGLTPTVP